MNIRLKNNKKQKWSDNITILSLMSLCLFFAASFFYANPAWGAECSKECSQVDKNQADGGCRIASSGGKLEGNSSTKLDTECIKRNSENGCFNAMPIEAGTGNYTMAGTRSSSRNHYGTDIGASGFTNSKAYAAADGTIEHAAWHNGSGRTLAIVHDKKCDTQGKGSKKYTTIYRHLWRVADKHGNFYDKPSATAGRSVKKNEVIGIVGGSNLTNKKYCDHPSQDFGRSGCVKGGSGFYDIHLHFELWDGDAINGTQAKTSTTLQPSCQSASVLCGGCPGEKCGTRNGGPIPFGDASAAKGVVEGEGAGYYAQSKCEYSEYLDSKNCVFCGLFRTIFNAASQIALMADQGLLKPTSDLVKIGFLIWLAIYLLKQLASFNSTDSGEMAKGILFQGFRVAVVALILSSTTSLFYVMDLTLNPVIMTGMNFIQDLNTTSTCESNAEYMQNIKGYSSADGYANSASPQGGLSKELGESIICSIKHLEDSTGLLMKLGNFSVCLSFHDKAPDWADGYIPHFGYLITGIFLWLAGLALLLTFPWCLVDSVLQLCIAAALVPCAIGAFAFKITSKYLKIVWDFFMNAMFNFVFLAIIIYIINSQMESLLDKKFDSAPVPEIFIDFNGFAWYGMGFIKVGATCFFCYVFFEEAKAMAEKFAASPGLGGSKGIGRMVGGTMMSMGAKSIKAAAHTTGKAVSTAGAGLNYAVGNQYRNARNYAVGAMASKFGRNSNTIGADGKTKGGSFRVFGRDIKVSATKGADGKWTLTRETHKRSKTDKAFEKVLDKNGNEMKDKNGNTVYEARHRILGITIGREKMTASKDENGNLVYSTADGKSMFRTDENGQITSYKTRFTRSYLGLGKAVEKQNVKQYGTNRTVNTTTSRTKENIDALGNVTKAETKMQEFSLFNKDLVRKDGTINTKTFNEMQKNMQNPEQAAKVLVAQTLETRGIKLDINDPAIKVKIDDKGRVNIQQAVKDGNGNITGTKNVQAEMIGNQMFIAVKTIDKHGNMTLHESNGIFHTVQRVTKQKDGTFSYDFEGGFSEYAISKNSFMSPLNYKGEWGNNIDRDKAMAGFSHDHFNKYIDQLNLKQMRRTMSTGAYNNSAEVRKLYSHIHGGQITLNEAGQKLAGWQNEATAWNDVFNTEDIKDEEQIAEEEEVQRTRERTAKEEEERITQEEAEDEAQEEADRAAQKTAEEEAQRTAQKTAEEGAQRTEEKTVSETEK